MTFLGFSTVSLALIGALATLIYYVLLMVYRLTLHPLANFPGPKLAAATQWYGAYYDFRRKTSYVKTFPELHDRYG